MGSFSNGLAAVSKKGKSGFINKKGKEVIGLRYDSAESFQDGLAVVSKKGKYGCIDKNGKEIIKLKYDQISEFSEGMAVVKLKEDYGYINRKGQEVIKPEYAMAGRFNGGLAMVSSHNKNGSECIDKNGKVVFKANYEQINDYFDEGYAVVYKKGKAGMIDKKGSELIKPKYN